MKSSAGASQGLLSGSVGFASRAAIQLLAFLVMIMATRALAVAEFGAYSIGAALVVFSRNLFYVGPYEYLMKTPDDPALKGSCFAANLFIAGVMSVLLAGFALLAPLLFETTTVRLVVLALVPSLFIAALTAWFEAMLLRGLAVRRYYLVTVTAEVASALVAIALLALSYGLLSLVAQVYVRLLVMLLIYAFMLPQRPWRAISYGMTVTVLRWSSLRYTSVLLNFGSNYGADFMLGILLSPAATGIYRAANRIVLAISDLFAQPLQKLIQTRVSARVARDLPAGLDWLVMFTGGAAIGWAVLAGLGAAAHVVVPLLLGEKWAAAAPVVVILCAVRALTLLDVATISLLVCLNQQRFMLIVQGAASTSVIATSFALAAVGPQAVALGTGCVMLGMTIALLRKAVALSGGTRGDLLSAVGTAAAPAIVVVVLIKSFQWAAPLGPLTAWQAAGASTVCGLAGAAIGLTLVRRQVYAAVGRFGGGVQPLPAT